MSGDAEGDDGRVTLHEEIAEILRASGAKWMTTQEIADQVNARGRYHKRDRSEVTAFQVHGRTKNYTDLFERDGASVRLKSTHEHRPTLAFNHLLAAVGLDPAEVRLVRHRDPQHPREVFDAALRGDPSFERYQELQSAENVVKQFRACRYLAAFVRDPMTRDTLFVGIWERRGERAEPW